MLICFEVFLVLDSEPPRLANSLAQPKDCLLSLLLVLSTSVHTWLPTAFKHLTFPAEKSLLCAGMTLANYQHVMNLHDLTSTLTPRYVNHSFAVTRAHHLDRADEFLEFSKTSATALTTN